MLDRHGARTTGDMSVQTYIARMRRPLALLLILEGLLPFAAPRVWREGFRHLTELTDGQLRFIGMIAQATGLFRRLYPQVGMQLSCR